MNESYYPPRLSGFFILLLSFVIFLSSVFLLLFIQRSANQVTITLPTYWEIYRDEKQRFMFEYPPTLSPLTDTGTAETYLVNKSASHVDCPLDGDCVVKISVTNLVFYFDRFYNAPENTFVNGNYLKISNTQIDGYPAVEYGYSQTQKTKEITENSKALMSGSSTGQIIYPRGLIINKNDNIIEISTDYYYGNFTKTFDQILSTFKFLNTPISSTPQSTFCGGFAGIACPTGYICQLEGNYPDAGGKCVNNCEQNGGTWNEVYRDCEGISRTVCQKLTGKFVECGSPCRHDPKAQACMDLCAVYCQF